MAALEHLGEAELAFFKAQELIESNIGQPGDVRDAVPDFLDPANLFGMRAERGIGKLCAGMFEPVVSSSVKVVCHA